MFDCEKIINHLPGSRYLGTSAKCGFRSYWPGPGTFPKSYLSLSSLPKVTFPLGDFRSVDLFSYAPGPGTKVALSLSLESLAIEYLPFPTAQESLSYLNCSYD